MWKVAEFVFSDISDTSTTLKLVNKPFIVFIAYINCWSEYFDYLRANVNMHQTAASHPKFAFTPTFIFCSSICPYNCGVVFMWKYIIVFEKLVF